MNLEPISGLEAVLVDFDLFLIDQFGVLHNGVEPYEGAIDALEMLKSNNKRVVIISNSGKRAGINVSRFEKLGFSSELFDHFITSGEVAFRTIESRLQESTIKSCFLISRDNDDSAVAGLGLDIVGDASKADLIIIGGSEAERYSENAYRDQLRQAAKNETRCICTNPDKKMLTRSGLQFGAGRIAEIYEELGGKVEWIGKPYEAIYQYILGLYKDCDRRRVLCIGDSVEHDIAGGNSVGLQTMLVRTGINTGLADDDIQKLFQQYNVVPEFIIPTLVF